MKSRSSGYLRRGLNLLLALAIVLTSVPSYALAYMAPKPDSITVVTADGAETTVDESWAATYPYGLFAFENREMTVLKGSTSQTIKVYRLGGSKGRAHLNIVYTPAYTQIGEDEMNYATAAGKNDIVIEVENTLPFARYQPLATEGEPWQPEIPVSLTVSDSNEDGEYTIAFEGVAADSYIWYAWFEGQWSPIENAVDATLVITEENSLARGYDYMCVFTIDGVRYGSDSAAGERYQRHSDDLGETIDSSILADMIASDYEQTFSVLPMDDEDEYSAYIFEMIFAEDEWVKEIKITAPENGLVKPDTFGALKMVGNEGGSIFQEASTVVIQIHDEDYTRSETQVGFDADSLRVDKAAGNAVVTVKRSGDLGYPVSLEWHTEDGSALAGVDYAASSGNVVFYADVQSAELTIPLIDDGIASEEERRFCVVLENLLGGGAEQSAFFLIDTVTINLYNSATAEVRNLPSALFDAALVDLSDTVAISSDALVAEKTAVTGELIETAEPTFSIPAAIDYPGQDGGGGGIMPFSFSYGAKLNFSALREDMNTYNGRYWNNVLAQVFYGNSGRTMPSNSNTVGRYDWLYSGAAPSQHSVEVDSNGVKRTDNYFGALSNKANTVYLMIDNIGKMFSRVDYRLRLQHRMRYSGNGEHYILEPSFYIGSTNPILNHRARSSLLGTVIPDDGTGKMDDYYNMTHSTGGSADFDFNTALRSINLYLKIMKMAGYKAPKTGSEHSTDNDALAGLEHLYLTRRAFGNDFGLRIFTANDINASYMTGSDINRLSLLDATEELYATLKPKVSIANGKGGINTSNKLFVGSTLQIETDNIPTYEMLLSDTVQHVFLSKKLGMDEVIVAKGKINADNPQHSDSKNSNSASLELIWDGITEADIASGDYTVNIVLERKQDMVVELLPSVPRLADGINIDTNRVGEAYQMLLSSNKGNGVTVEYSAAGWQANIVGSGSEFITYELRKTKVDLPTSMSRFGSETAFKLSPSMDINNIQTINFNLNPEDRILYGGATYRGNETITIKKDHMNNTIMAFRYYNKDYLTALSVMVPLISDVALYLDNNGNNRIDGYFDTSRNIFIIDDTQDELVGYLTLESYEETVFAPVRNAQGNYVNHFVAIEYTITPRCLVVPPNASADDRAQVLPVLTTSANNVNSLSKMTREQRGYRYVASGPLTVRPQSGSQIVKPFSSDDIMMYGEEASNPNVVNFAAGGDRSPAVRSDPRNFTSMYVWNPDFQGSLLFKFDKPEPVIIEDSLAGKNIPIARFTGRDVNGDYLYEEGGIAKLNGFLGSLSGVDTFAITVTQQVYDKNANRLIPQDELKGLPEIPLPEASRLSGISLFPNADHLLVIASDPEAKPDGQNAGNENQGDYDEYNLDAGVKLPNIQIGLSDYVTIIMDGYDIGFAIGIPLAAAERKSTGSDVESVTQNPKTANTENAGKFKQFFTGAWGQLTKDEAYQNAKREKANPTGENDSKGNPKMDKGEMSSSSIKVSFNMRLGFMFTYNPLDNGYYFSKLAISIAVAFEFKYTYRLTVCPIVYVYVKVGVGLTLSTGMQVVREVVEDTTNVDLTDALNRAESEHKFVQIGLDISGKRDDYIEITPKYKAYNIYFTGKLLIQMKEKDATAWTSFGSIASKDIAKSVTVILKQQDGYEIAADDQFEVRFVALEDVMIRTIVPIIKADSHTYWNGMKLAPSALFEVGAGLGVDMLKIELFAQLAIDMSMTFGAYDPVSRDYAPFTFDYFQMKLGIGVRVVLLFFTIEKEAIQYILNYQRGRSGQDQAPWMHGYSALGGAFAKMYPIKGQDDSSQASSGYSLAIYGEEPGEDLLKLPQSTVGKQRIKSYSDSPIRPMAFEPTNAPFELSGYGSSGDAFTLVEGLSTGFEYQVLTIGEKNYLLYHLSRSSAEAEDASMLVLSEIVITGSGANDYGLCNPVDPSSADLYIIVDHNSTTGDLDFNAWVDGNTLKTAWVSYQKAAPLLTASFVAYEEEGKTTIKVIDPSSAHHYVYQVGGTEVTGINVDDALSDVIACTGDVADFTSGEYEVAEDQWFTIYELNSTDRVVRYLSHQIKDDEVGTEPVQPTALPLSIADRLANAAQSTVVKAASWTVGAAAFTEAEIISTPSTKTVFSPRVSGDAVLHLTAEPYTPGELIDAVDDYKAYLGRLFDAESDAVGGNIAFLTEYYRSTKQVFGKENTLNVSAMNANGQWFSANTKLTENSDLFRSVENIEFTKIGDQHYLAYTTVEENYENGELVYIKRLMLRSISIDPNADGGIGNIEFGQPYLLRTLLNYDNPNLNNRDGVFSGGSVSEDNKYIDPYFADLKFLNAKLGELTGNEETFTPFAIDLNDGRETFLLFEMNGNTYVIPENDLQNITETGDPNKVGKGRIIPFFTMETYLSLNDKGEQELVDAAASGYIGVTIGADNEGNIAAVYVGTVANTGNNAIYISRYYTNTYSDENGEEQTVTAWKSAQMLAMNQMQVYEDAMTHGWNDDETHQKYLAGISGDPEKSSAALFRFSNLQFAMHAKAEPDSGPDPLHIASLEDIAIAADEALTSAGTVSFGMGGTVPVEMRSGSPVVARASSAVSNSGKTLILTEGVLTRVYERSFGTDTGQEPVTAIMPVGQGEVGFYAIAFGQGEQELGNVSISIDNSELQKEHSIKTDINFTNTGTTRIRGSEANPIIVTLKLAKVGSSESEAVAAWKIVDSIDPGQEVVLDGMAMLPRDVLAKDYFYFTVEEDKIYIADNPFKANSYITNDSADTRNYPIGRYIVEDLPDLGFEQVAIRSVGVDSGGRTILEAKFYVTNRGTATAVNAFAQFKAQTGIDMDDNPIYKPLSLADAKFNIGNQEPVVSLFSAFALDEMSRENGILKLESTAETGGDGDDIEPGYGRLVEGTFYANSGDYITNTVNGADELILEMELFSIGDDTQKGDDIQYQLVQGDGYSGRIMHVDQHNELTSLNNTHRAVFNHKTYYTAASNIAIPLGTPLLLPIGVNTTYSSQPSLIASEVRNNDVSGEEPNCLGVLYYDETLKCIAISPSREGTGIIRITDTRDNNSYDILFTVTEKGEGINVFRNNDMFSFYNSASVDASGNYNDPYDPENPDQSSQKWSFVTGVSDWNPDPDINKPNREIMPPYLNDISRGKQGALFTYNTLAVSTVLYFSGEISVSSSYPGFSTTTLASEGGNSGSNAREVVFAPDPSAVSTLTHTVTIKVLSTEAQFDRYVERYGASVTPTPYDDVMAPQLYWSRSFPRLASLQPGTGPIPLRLTIIDDSGISALNATDFAAQGMVLTKLTPTFWYLDWNVKDNGSFTFDAIDVAGNVTSRTVHVGWFAKDASGDARAPELSAEIKVDNTPWQFGSIIGKENVSAVRLAYDSFDAEEVQVKVEYGRYLYKEDGDSGYTNEVIGFDFETITNSDENGFVMSSNGVYRITATDTSDAGGRYRSVYLLFNGIDSAVPMLAFSQSVNTTGEAVLYYNATKNVSGLFGGGTSGGAGEVVSPLSRITINGANVPLQGGQSGSVAESGNWKPATGLYNGSYTLYAEDKAGNSATMDTVVKGISIALANGALTLESDWTQQGGEGWLALDTAKISGGSYDPTIFNTSGDYRGSYEGVLVAASKAFVFKDTADILTMTAEEKDTYEEARAKFISGLSFVAMTGTATIDKLSAGDYLLYIRDALEPDNHDVIAAQPVRILSEAISFNATPEGTFAEDGRITVVAYGGINGLGTYQFALQSAGNNQLLPAADPSWFWCDADDWETQFNTKTFEALKPGRYQLAVRPMPAITQSDLLEYGRLHDECTWAEERNSIAWEAYGTLQDAKTQYNVTKVAYDNDPDDEDLEDLFWDAMIKLAQLCEEAFRLGSVSAPADLEDQFSEAAEILQAVCGEATVNLYNANGKFAVQQSKITDTVYDAYDQNPEFYRNALVKLVEVVQYCTVTFDLDGGTRTGGGDLVQTLIAGNAAEAPEVSREGYRFTGWNSEFTHVTASITVTAQWERRGSNIPPYNYPNVSTGTQTDTKEPVVEKPVDPEVTLPDEKIPLVEKPIVPDKTELSVRSTIGGITILTAPEQDPVPEDDGTWLLSGGAVIETPGGIEIAVPPGTLLSIDGQIITLPRGSVGALITWPDGSTERGAGASEETDANNEFVEPGMTIEILDPNGTARDALRIFWINPFIDLAEDDWFYADTCFTYRRGLMGGMAETEFAPQLTMTRAMLITVLHRLAGSPDAGDVENPFSDVDEDAWYYEAVKWAVARGIASGYGTGLLGSEDPVSRQDLAVFLSRIADFLNLDLPQIRDYTGFSDEAEIADYAHSSLQRLYCAGIIGGRPGNIVDPHGVATRAELAAMLHRFILATQE